MPALYLDGNYTTPQVDGPRRWLRPFDDVFSQVAFEQDYQQLEANFNPLALDTPSPDFADAFLVRESELQGLGGGVVKWTRTYARIPDSRQRFESYSWTVPGIGSEAVYTPVTISSAANGPGTTTLTTGSSSTAGVGDSVLVNYTFTDALTGTQYGRDVLRTCLAGTSGTTVVVALIFEPGGTITFNTLVRVEPGRDPYSEEVGSLVQLDYFLPGVSTGIATPQDIPIIAPVTIFDNTGRQTTSFSATTSPTLASYRAQVAAGAYICAVRSIPRRWMGNIYERATRYVLAI